MVILLPDLSQTEKQDFFLYSGGKIYYNKSNRPVFSP